MLIRASLIALCCALASAAVNAQVNAPLQAEQLETGFTNFPGHPHIRYSIRLLPVSSFPQLPLPVTDQLVRIGCMIPQTYEARGPENIITGAFERPGSKDWAVLCSVKGRIKARGNNFRSTTLYVFFESDYTKPIPLRSQPDSKWVGTEWSHDYGSAWGISTVHADALPHTDQTDHDGIEDSDIEQSSVVHYFKEGHWVTLDSTQ